MKRKIFIIFVCLQSTALAPIDPFSKITITSDTATCKVLKSDAPSEKTHQEKKPSDQYVVDYQKNVRVVLADQSTITADALNIFFDGNSQELKNKALSNFKKITFSNNICITNAQRTATADKAELFLANKKCTLLGNVKIRQTKQRPSDVPISIDSQCAEFSFDDKQISFTGTSEYPVSTTIVLEGHPSMTYKKDLKKKKHGKHKNSSTRHSS